MISGDRILRCDFRRGKSEKIMDLPRAIGLSWIYRASSLSEEKKRPRWEPRPMLLAIRTLEHLVIANTDGKELERYTIPESLRADSVTFYLLDNRTVLAQAYQRREGGQVAELTWFDLGGRTLRRESVVANEASILGRPAAENWLVMTFLPSPVAMLGAAVMDVHQHGALEAGGNWGPALGRAVSDRWPPLAAVSLLSAALAWLCYCRQRRYALPGTAVWVAFVFLAGVPGLLGYLFHRRWPVLEPCPACAKTAPRDREACAHCRSEFPRPAPRGIEVFA
jgi:hypothetical protein